MTKSDFENLIKGLSVDEMIEMMPKEINWKKLILSHRQDDEDEEIYYYAYYWAETVKASSPDEVLTCKIMLLWLFDNNLLPEYKQDV